MKKIIAAMIIPLLLFSCKKDDLATETADQFLIKKYARYGTAVYDNAEMKGKPIWLAKAEEVQVNIESSLKNDKGEEILAVKLTDGSSGFVFEKHMADKPVIFIEDTRAHVRNNVASNVAGTIPAGSIGFIIEEKADWVQVYVGQVDGKWITRHWVKDGYRADDDLLIDAKIYEEAVSTLAKKEASAADIKNAKEKLEELSGAGNLFANLASKKLEELTGEKDTAVEAEQGFSEISPEEKARMAQ